MCTAACIQFCTFCRLPRMYWEWLELSIKKRIATVCFDTTKAPIQLCGTKTYHKGTRTTLWYQNIPQRHQYNSVVPKHITKAPIQLCGIKTYHKDTNTTLWYQTIPQRHQYNFVVSKHTATILQQGTYKGDFKLQWRASVFFCDKIWYANSGKER